MEVLHAPQVKEFIDGLDAGLAGRVQRMVALLESNGADLRMPYSKPVRKGMFELRVLGASQVRILYFFHDARAITLHAFLKKRGALSPKDIAYAESVRKTILASI
jgi:hypothetical protein